MGLRAGLLARNSFGLILRFPRQSKGNLEEEGGNMSEYLLEMKGICKEFPGVKLAQYDTVDNLLLDLQSGRIDLAFAGPIKLDGDFLQKPRGEKFHFVGPEINNIALFGPGVGVALRKEDSALRDQIDAALNASFKDGSFKAINDRYWSFSVLP